MRERQRRCDLRQNRAKGIGSHGSSFGPIESCRQGFSVQPFHDEEELLPLPLQVVNPTYARMHETLGIDGFALQ